MNGPIDPGDPDDAAIGRMIAAGEANLSLYSVEVETIRHLLSAVEALQKAGNLTSMGFAEDHCENAMVEIRRAMRSVGG